MFERNKVDSGPSGTAGGAVPVPVEITLATGESIDGRVLLQPGRTIWDMLNGPNTFIELEPYVGERTYLAKAAIRGIKLISVPGVGHLTGRLREMDGFEPFAVLGLKRDAAFDEVRAAFHRLAKVYHPDRYQSFDLPNEVRDYLSAVARRINIAFATLEKAHQGSRGKPAYQPSTPIYTR